MSSGFFLAIYATFMPHFLGFCFEESEKSGVLGVAKHDAILAIEGQKNFIEMRRFGLF
jgi:hypothetical protein